MVTTSQRLNDGLLRSALESSPTSVAVLDLAGVMQFANSAGLAFLGLSDPAAITGCRLASLWPETRRPEIERAIEAASKGEIRRVDVQAPGYGRLTWWTLTLSPLRHDDGQP